MYSEEELSKIQLLAKWFIGPLKSMRKKGLLVPKEDLVCLINLVHSGTITRNYAEKHILPKLGKTQCADSSSSSS
jgi:hypothetical protein